MILTCPSCSASYNVPIEAIGIEGRQVRCKKCAHVWFQEGEKKAIDDIISKAQSQTSDDIGFDEGELHRSRVRQSVREGEKSTGLSDHILTKLKFLSPQKLKTLLSSMDKAILLKHFAGFMVALAVFSCVFLVLVSVRGGVVRFVPSFEALYKSAGFPLVDYADVNPEEALTIDRLMVSQDGQKISGDLINLTSQNVKIPVFKIDFVGEDGKTLQTEKRHLPIAILRKELSYHFDIDGSDNIKGKFASVKISFAE